MGNAQAKPIAVPAEVQRRADEARAKQHDRLDLSQADLTLIPDRLHLPNVRLFLAQRNHLSQLSASFCQRWTQLTSIDLSHNHISGLPTDFARLTQLQHILLTGNDLQELDEATLQSFVHLRRLEAGSNRLARIPSSLFRLPSLELAVFRSNQVLQLPLPPLSPNAQFTSDVCRLAHLTKLDISRNRIEILPLALLDAMPNLAILIASVNHIHTITTDPSNSSSLSASASNQSLAASTNSDTGLISPRLLGSFRSGNDARRPSQLPASQSAVQKVSDSGPVTYPASLQSLDLQENALVSMPLFVQMMKNIVSLNLSSNKLTALPSPLSHLLSLETLLLASNHLSALPQEISFLTSLDELDVSNNSLHSLPNAIGAMRCLRKLQAQRNRISVLNSSVWMLPSIRVINLTSNKISALPPIDADQAPITGCLAELYLADNNLSEFPAPLVHISSLTTLGLSYNEIPSLPEDIDKLGYLRNLFLSGNQLWDLPAKLKDIFGLSWIYINHNRLRDLPSVISDMPLEIIDFTGIDAASVKETLPSADASSFSGVGRRRSDGFRVQPKITQSNRFNVGYAEMIGRRPAMEDSMAIRGNFRSSNSEDFFGVFDGHGTGGKGKIAADYIAYHIPRELESEMDALLGSIKEAPKAQGGGISRRKSKGRQQASGAISTVAEVDEEGENDADDSDDESDTEVTSPVLKRTISIKLDADSSNRNSQPNLLVLDNGVTMMMQEEYTIDVSENEETKAIQNKMKEVFLKINKELCEEIKQLGDVIGSTAAVVYIRKKRLHVANAGDSRVVLCRDNIAVQLTVDHRPHLSSEGDRIKKAGGFVSPAFRVNNELSVSRAFGDIRLSSVITAEPYLVSIHISRSRDQFLVIACDGLFDVMTNQQVVDQVLLEFRKPARSATAAACRLRDMAYQLGSTDNISVVVVFLS